MTFTVAEGVQLVAWLVFVWWEVRLPSRKDIQWYTHERRKVWWFLNPPSWVFPPVWICLKLMVTASVFLYFKFVAEQNPAPTQWQFLGVYITFLINILMAKMWSPLFFGARMVGVAFANAATLAATAIAITVFMGLSADLMAPNMYIAPLVLYIPYALWLIYAAFVNWAWIPGGMCGMKAKVEASPDKFEAKLEVVAPPHRHRHRRHHSGDELSEPLLDINVGRRR